MGLQKNFKQFLYCCMLIRCCGNVSNRRSLTMVRFGLSCHTIIYRRSASTRTEQKPYIWSTIHLKFAALLEISVTSFKVSLSSIYLLFRFPALYTGKHLSIYFHHLINVLVTLYMIFVGQNIDAPAVCMEMNTAITGPMWAFNWASQPTSVLFISCNGTAI
jgi:hypothetical protein